MCFNGLTVMIKQINACTDHRTVIGTRFTKKKKKQTVIICVVKSTVSGSDRTRV